MGAHGVRGCSAVDHPSESAIYQTESCVRRACPIVMASGYLRAKIEAQNAFHQRPTPRLCVISVLGPGESHHANHLRDTGDGLKVGGHQASSVAFLLCADSVHHLPSRRVPHLIEINSGRDAVQ
jgi:hypothetical protein